MLLPLIHHKIKKITNFFLRSDEIGCPSRCGTVADLFSSSNVLFHGSLYDINDIHSSQCLWRIHGEIDKFILLEISLIPTRLKRFQVSNKIAKIFSKLKISAQPNLLV